MNESFHKVDNDQEQIPYGNGMGEGNGVRLHKLQRELFFHLIFKNKREKTLKSKLHWLVYREHNQLASHSWYSKNVWESAALPGEGYTRDEASSTGNQISIEARSSGLGRLRVCGSD